MYDLTKEVWVDYNYEDWLSHFKENDKEIFIDQFAAQLMRILGRRLPQERSQIVVIRTLAATLIIDKPRIAIMIEHHVASLELAIKETLAYIISIVRKVLRKQAEIGLKLQFVEIDLRCFQETILKIVQVEQNTIYIKLSLRIAVGEIELLCPTNLDIR